MKTNKTESLYRVYLDGQAMYSNGTVAPAVLTAEGWEVQPSRLANAHERMTGAAKMRRAVIGMLEAGGPLNSEVARDLAHWLSILNDGRAAGLFVPLALAADDAAAVIDDATDETMKARREIADTLTQSGTVSDLYRAALIDSLNRADRGRLAGLAAPKAERIAALSEASENAEQPVQTPASRRAGHDLTNERGCRRAILEHWDEIEQLHGAGADSHQVLRVLKRSVDPSAKIPALKTVQNKMGELRKEGFIP